MFGADVALKKVCSGARAPFVHTAHMEQTAQIWTQTAKLAQTAQAAHIWTQTSQPTQTTQIFYFC